MLSPVIQTGGSVLLPVLLFETNALIFECPFTRPGTPIHNWCNTGVTDSGLRVDGGSSMQSELLRCYLRINKHVHRYSSDCVDF